MRDKAMDYAPTTGHEAAATAEKLVAGPLRGALNSLLNECKCTLSLAEAEISQAAGVTNLRCLQRRMAEAEAALASLPSSPPRQLLDEKVWQLRERGKELAKNPQEYFRGMADGFESVANELDALASPVQGVQARDSEVQRWKDTADTYMLEALTEGKNLISLREHMDKNYIHKDNVAASPPREPSYEECRKLINSIAGDWHHNLTNVEVYALADKYLVPFLKSLAAASPVQGVQATVTSGALPNASPPSWAKPVVQEFDIAAGQRAEGAEAGCLKVGDKVLVRGEVEYIDESSDGTWMGVKVAGHKDAMEFEPNELLRAAPPVAEKTELGQAKSAGSQVTSCDAIQPERGDGSLGKVSVPQSQTALGSGQELREALERLEHELLANEWETQLDRFAEDIQTVCVAARAALALPLAPKPAETPYEADQRRQSGASYGQPAAPKVPALSDEDAGRAAYEHWRAVIRERHPESDLSSIVRVPAWEQANGSTRDMFTLAACGALRAERDGGK